MEFYKNLYISPRVRNHRQVRRDLVRGKGHLRIYVLVLAKNGSWRSCTVPISRQAGTARILR